MPQKKQKPQPVEDRQLRLVSDFMERVHGDVLGWGVLPNLRAIAISCKSHADREDRGKRDPVSQQIYNENVEFLRDAHKRINVLCDQIQAEYGDRLPQMGDGDTMRFGRRHVQLTKEREAGG